MITINITLPSTVVATCLKPIRSTFDHGTGNITVLGALYLNQEAALAGAQPLEPPQEYFFSAQDVAQVVGGIPVTQIVTALLATHPRFNPLAPGSEEAPAPSGPAPESVPGLPEGPDPLAEGS